MSDMTAEQSALRALAYELAETAPEAIDCDTTLSRVAAYFEALPLESPLPRELEQVRLHLAACPDCLEALELLVAGVQSERDRP